MIREHKKKKFDRLAQKAGRGCQEPAAHRDGGRALSHVNTERKKEEARGRNPRGDSMTTREREIRSAPAQIAMPPHFDSWGAKASSDDATTTLQARNRGHLAERRPVTSRPGSSRAVATLGIGENLGSSHADTLSGLGRAWFYHRTAYGTFKRVETLLTLPEGFLAHRHRCLAGLWIQAPATSGLRSQFASSN